MSLTDDIWSSELQQISGCGLEVDPNTHGSLMCVLQGREGEIRHLFRGFAFLHCKKLVENGGMFVCKTRHLVLAGGSKVGMSLAARFVVCWLWFDLSCSVYFLLCSLCAFQPRDVTNFTVGGFAPMSPRISSPMHHGGGGECPGPLAQAF